MAEKISQDKKDAIRYLYDSNIDVEFISMQVDLDIPEHRTPIGHNLVISHQCACAKAKSYCLQSIITSATPTVALSCIPTKVLSTLD